MDRIEQLYKPVRANYGGDFLDQLMTGRNGKWDLMFQDEPPFPGPSQIDLGDTVGLLDELIAGSIYITETDPAQRAKFLEEMIRHFENRAKTDPSREVVRPCLENEAANSILHQGLDLLVQAGFELYDLGHSLLIRNPSNNFTFIFGQYRGSGQNNGTAFLDNKELPSKAKPISLDQANSRLTDLVNGNCRNKPVPVASTVTVPESIPTTSPQTEYNLPPLKDLGPAPLYGGLILGIVVLVSLGRGLTRRQA